MYLRLLLVLLIFLISSQAFAIQRLFKINITNYGVGPGNTVLPDAVKTQIDTLFASIETEVNKKLPDADASQYLKGMSDAGVIAVKGIGVDYASAPDIFVVGAGVGLGADVGNNSLSDLTSGNIDANQLRGVGAQVSAMVGLNLKIFKPVPFKYFDLNKVTLFANFWSMSLPSIKDVQGKLSNFGFHMQYQFIDEYKTRFKLFRWGGLFFTTGFDHSYMRATFKKDFVQRTTKTITDASLGGSASMIADFTGTTTAGAEVSVNTIPFEVSTHVQLLYILTLFGGLGMDWNFGEAKALASVAGNVVANDANSKITGVQANANLNLGDSGGPTSLNARWFTGGQLNLSLLKIYAQLNHGIGQNTWGINAGVRIAY